MPWAYIRTKDGRAGGAYIREEKHFNLQSVKLTFLSFFQYKARISAFFKSCKMSNMFKVNNKDTRILVSVSIVDFDQLIAGWGCCLLF